MNYSRFFLKFLVSVPARALQWTGYTRPLKAASAKVNALLKHEPPQKPAPPTDSMPNTLLPPPSCMTRRRKYSYLRNQEAFRSWLKS